MNEFLEQVWLGNQVKYYLITAAVILFVWLFKKFISRYIAGLLYRLVHNIWRSVDKQAFVKLVLRPLGLFLAILISIAALYKLSFPDELNVQLYRYRLKQITHTAGTLILIISMTGLLLRIIDFIALLLEKKANLTSDQSDNQLIVFFKDFFKVIIVIIGVMLVLRYAFGLNVAGLLTGLSIVGAAIALALRESLENLIASFIIFFDKPFITGDLVQVNQITGHVERIGLRSTRIRTEQKTFVTVPNKQMVDSILDNHSLRTQRRGDLRLELELATKTEQLELLLHKMSDMLKQHQPDDFSVHLTEINGHAIVLQGHYFTPPVTIADFNAQREKINMQSLRLLEELGIEIAGSNTRVVLAHT